MVARPARGGRAVLMSAVVLVVSGCASAPRTNEPAGPDAENKASFKLFKARVEDYARRQKAAEDALSRAKVSDDPAEIVARQQALATMLREARPEARQGDVFSAEVGDSFRRVILGQFQGDTGANIRATLAQGDALKPWPLAVNQPYPETVASTTVPPSLLLSLPELPDGLRYRIVGRDLVLLDAKTNLVIDVLIQALP